MRILIIDDEERLAETFRLALSPPHDVTIASSGRAALSVLDEDAAFDVVLMDVMMPDVSGPEIFETVRTRDPELAERFVFMTGGAFTEDARDFLRRESNPRLDKPFPIAVLDELLESVSAKSSGRRGT